MYPGIRIGLFMTSQGSHTFKEPITATGDTMLLPAESVILQKPLEEFLPHPLDDNMFKTANAHAISLFSEFVFWQQKCLGTATPLLELIELIFSWLVTSRNPLWQKLTERGLTVSPVSRDQLWAHKMALLCATLGVNVMTQRAGRACSRGVFLQSLNGRKTNGWWSHTADDNSPWAGYESPLTKSARCGRQGARRQCACFRAIYQGKVSLDGMTLCVWHVGVCMKCAFLVISERFMHVKNVNIKHTFNKTNWL